jgi:hypothetical protein
MSDDERSQGAYEVDAVREEAEPPDLASAVIDEGGVAVDPASAEVHEVDHEADAVGLTPNMERAVGKQARVVRQPRRRV